MTWGTLKVADALILTPDVLTDMETVWYKPLIDMILIAFLPSPPPPSLLCFPNLSNQLPAPTSLC